MEIEAWSKNTIDNLDFKIEVQYRNQSPDLEIKPRCCYRSSIFIESSIIIERKFSFLSFIWLTTKPDFQLQHL